MLSCSFCGKSSDEVSHLIAGPNVYICSDCVDLCVEIIEEERTRLKDIRIELAMMDLLP